MLPESSKSWSLYYLLGDRRASAENKTDTKGDDSPDFRESLGTIKKSIYVDSYDNTHDKDTLMKEDISESVANIPDKKISVKEVGTINKKPITEMTQVRVQRKVKTINKVDLGKNNQP